MRVRSTRLTNAPCRSNSCRTSLPLPPARHQRVPAIRRFAAARFERFDVKRDATIQSAALDGFEGAFFQLATHADAELAQQRVHGALEFLGEPAIGRHDFETAVDTRHRADGDEPITRTTRQAIDESLMFAVRGSRLFRHAQVFAGRAMAEIDLTRHDFVAMDESSIETQVIGATDARAEHGNLAVHGDAAGLDPLFRLTTRGDTHAGEHLLQAFGFTGMTRACRRMLFGSGRFAGLGTSR